MAQSPRNTHLIWFRNDLRVTDNLALVKACEDPEATVIALFIATPQQWRHHDMAPRQASVIHTSLVKLQSALAELGIALIYQQCDDFKQSVAVVSQICQQYQVKRLFYTHQYGSNEQQRDERVRQQLSPDVLCSGYHSNLFFAPLSVVNGKNEMYKVFTPYRNALLKQVLQSQVKVYPTPKPRGDKVKTLSIPPFAYPKQDDAQIEVGEAAALAQLAYFCREHVDDYASARDIPAQDKTSRLSVYLTVGTLSVKQCFQRLLLEHPQFWQYSQSGAFAWFNELVWREFYQHLLVAYPHLSKHKPFIAWTDNIIWRNNQSDFTRWQQGQTGYPIVDAAMRQLNQSGWMHNRLRMIVASFLVKDLLIDWRWGERYFMSQLLDGDLAANNGGWQWAASTGTDAAPYFRIFNPTRQGIRFDPQGEFVRKWLPELSSVPDKYIHTPHQWPEYTAQKLDYPLPIVDHAQARVQTLMAFEAAKNG